MFSVNADNQRVRKLFIGRDILPALTSVVMNIQHRIAKCLPHKSYAGVQTVFPLPGVAPQFILK